MTLGIVGAGNMASAIMQALAGSNSPLARKVYDIDAEKTAAAAKYGAVPCGSIEELADADYLLLAIKPQGIAALMDTVATFFKPNTVLISILAGISSDYYCGKLGFDAKVVTVMPNTPLLVGKGATALAKNPAVSDEEFETVKNIFALSGVVGVLPEDKMKEIIAINGSSPAFIYLFAKGFLDYAESVGIPEETAKTLFCGTLEGAAKMITTSDKPIDELIRAVCSPGGTTLAGMEELYAGNLTDVVGNACTACTRRAYELAQQ